MTVAAHRCNGLRRAVGSEAISSRHPHFGIFKHAFEVSECRNSLIFRAVGQPLATLAIAVDGPGASLGLFHKERWRIAAAVGGCASVLHLCRTGQRGRPGRSQSGKPDPVVARHDAIIDTCHPQRIEKHRLSRCAPIARSIGGLDGWLPTSGLTYQREQYLAVHEGSSWPVICYVITIAGQ